MMHGKNFSRRQMKRCCRNQFNQVYSKINSMKDLKLEDIQLMFGDCLERMKEIPDGSIDCIVTDPPYMGKLHGINLNYCNYKQII